MAKKQTFFFFFFDPTENEETILYFMERALIVSFQLFTCFYPYDILTDVLQVVPCLKHTTERNLLLTILYYLEVPYSLRQLVETLMKGVVEAVAGPHYNVKFPFSTLPEKEKQL